MARVLTSAAVITCSHQTGVVTVRASQQVLTAGRQAVLVRSDLDGAKIARCSNDDPSKGLTPCTTTGAPSAGLATNLSVGDEAVLTEEATGTTDSKPPGTWAVHSPGQAVLEAT